jgi:inhibitor of Bruton tyrosine kinase
MQISWHAMEDDAVPKCADQDCGPKCSSSQHAAQLINAVTKASPLQSLLFLSRCHNAAYVRDRLGRTVLHVAAACGCATSVITELACHRDLSIQDLESGWTALHRALFYGQLASARLLISVRVLFLVILEFC